MGSHTFAFSDGDHALDLDVLSGASLIVGFTSPSDTTVYRLQAYHGLDFAHGDDPTAGASRVTAPITVARDAAFVPRIAELTVIAGGGTAARADRIDVAGRGSTTGCLSAADGEQWDARSLPRPIPAGVTSSSVSLASPPAGDALLWVAAVVRSRASGSVPVVDQCPDLDGDGIVNAFDSDRDGDGVADADEAARGTSPTSADSDGDGARDGGDSCPALANPDQRNTDGRADGGDACDGDDDDDGHADGVDNCVLTPNADQIDRDGDGRGAACDLADLADGRCANAITGNPSAQALTGTPFGDIILGRGGGDRIDGGAGDDCLAGEGGADSVTGGDGADALDGGAGDDALDGDDGNDALSGGAGNDSITGGPGRDRLTGGRGRNAYSWRRRQGLDQRPQRRGGARQMRRRP